MGRDELLILFKLFQTNNKVYAGIFLEASTDIRFLTKDVICRTLVDCNAEGPA